MTPDESKVQPFTRRTELLLALLLALASFAVRAYQIGYYSLSEDETVKWEAIQQYRHGHFAGVNAEHPMLMKLMAWASLSAAEQWNTQAIRHHWRVISTEGALRLPNVVVGAATTFVLYLLARALLGPIGALAAAAFWAFSPLPVSLNRLLKEETPLVFFSLLACYFYLQAKKSCEEARTRRHLDFSAISFGLAFASKYALQLFGLNAFVWYLAGRAGLDGNPFGRRLIRFYLVLGLTFILVNPVILVPSNIANMLSWVNVGGIHHTGYNLHGQLYLNQPSFHAPTMPWYFYVWLLVLKTPLPVLAAVIAGSFLLLRRRQSLPFLFFASFALLQLLGLSAFPAKWIRYSLGVLPFVFIAGGRAIEQLSEWARHSGVTARAFGVAAMLLLMCAFFQLRSWAPYYSLYLNAFGGGSNNIAQYFSPDEISELDARQNAAAVCRSAVPQARLATSKPLSMNYYLKRCGRADIQVLPLYDRDYTPLPGDLILREESRRYFETDHLLESLRSSQMVHQDIRVGPVVATTIYSFHPLPVESFRHRANISLIARNTITQELLKARPAIIRPATPRKEGHLNELTQ